ncbi:hypothetical protein N1851_032981 [Merluccius polli]|uniref:Reverse transcriptase domain-containing protein n=1 Tax=Merluccius polli TaxID=89951 RepID=A0AA47NPY6_MERPO|nr:hypothetical protein N1851_032981 [Merluccius polli]
MPRLWKQAELIPVPKVSRPKTLNNFRPVTLTSLLIKSFEKIVKSELLGRTAHALDPMQFAYRAHNMRKSENRHILKFADDTVIVSLLHNNESSHGPVMEDFIRWCDLSFLNSGSNHDPTVIKGQSVECVDNYKYLGISLLSFALVSWFGNLSLQDKNSLNQIIKWAGRLIGKPQLTMSSLYDIQLQRKATCILKDGSHPLHELKRVQRELKRSIRESKDNFKRKLEHKLENNNTRDVWSRMREITGFQRRGGGAAVGNERRANELNMFFNRFSSNPPTCSRHLSAPPSLPPPCNPPLTTPSPQSGLHITASQVRRELERLKQRQAAGPDRISPHVLKACSSQLCGVLQHLFNLSLHLQRVPLLWKTQKSRDVLLHWRTTGRWH